MISTSLARRPAPHSRLDEDLHLDDQSRNANETKRKKTVFQLLLFRSHVPFPISSKMLTFGDLKYLTTGGLRKE